jgi:hypothetical protein
VFCNLFERRGRIELGQREREGGRVGTCTTEYNYWAAGCKGGGTLCRIRRFSSRPIIESRIKGACLESNSGTVLLEDFLDNLACLSMDPRKVTVQPILGCELLSATRRATFEHELAHRDMLLPTLLIHRLVMLITYFRRVHEVYTSHGHRSRTECSQSRVRMQTWCVRLSCGGVALITAVQSNYRSASHHPHAASSIKIASG